MPTSDAVPGPPVLGVRRRVHAHEPASCLDVALERGLLRVVRDVAGREQEHHRPVLPEVRVGEGAASSVWSTPKPFAAPRFWTAWIAAGIESCRNSAVFVKTRIFQPGSAAAGRRAKAEGAQSRGGREDR